MTLLLVTECSSAADLQKHTPASCVSFAAQIRTAHVRPFGPAGDESGSAWGGDESGRELFCSRRVKFEAWIHICYVYLAHVVLCA